jgi:hypothetical protein
MMTPTKMSRSVRVSGPVICRILRLPPASDNFPEIASVPDNMPQAITVTDAQGRWAVYVPLRIGGKIVVPDNRAH